MPIYAYACDACGHRQDHLQKMADAVLTICPSCDASTYTKQLSAPPFQLKGGGWYVTDFRDGGKKDAKKADGEGKSGDTAAAGDGNSAAAKSDAKSDTRGDTKGDAKSDAKAGSSSADSSTAGSSTSGSGGSGSGSAASTSSAAAASASASSSSSSSSGNAKAA